MSERSEIVNHEIKKFRVSCDSDGCDQGISVETDRWRETSDGPRLKEEYLRANGWGVEKNEGGQIIRVFCPRCVQGSGTLLETDIAG